MNELIVSVPEPLSTCTKERLLVHHNPHGHAMLWARVLLWNQPLGSGDFPARELWSRWAWWSSMWYPHKGPPCWMGCWKPIPSSAEGWCVIRMDVTHWMHKPPPPVGAPTGDGNNTKGRD
jgi:hypothetical protein